jgi:hypothetical protein
MNVEIINKPFTIDIYGFSGIVINKDYAGTAFKLMDRMWAIVKSEGLTSGFMNPMKKCLQALNLTKLRNMIWYWNKKALLL